MSKAKNKVFFSDFDGTLIEDNSSLSLMIYMQDNNLISESLLAKTSKLLTKFMGKRISRDDFIVGSARIFASALKGQSKDFFSTHAGLIAEDFTPAPGVSELQDFLDRKGYDLVIHSGSLYNVVSEGCKLLGLRPKRVLATNPETRHGNYTGEITDFNVLTPRLKERYIDDYITSHEVEEAVIFENEFHLVDYARERNIDFVFRSESGPRTRKANNLRLKLIRKSENIVEKLSDYLE